MPLDDDVVREELRRVSRRGFLGAGLVAAGVGVAWNRLAFSPRDGRIDRALRSGLRLHERAGRAVFSRTSRATEFPSSEAEELQVYGNTALWREPDPATYRLQVSGGEDEGLQRELNLQQIFRELPRVEMTCEIRCVDGWSAIVHWSGVRLRDLALGLGIASRTGRAGDVFSRRRDALNYCSIATPDEAYYVGLDAESTLHHQTLLCDRINGQPLDNGHGSPVRLVIPTKYGFKWLKRVGIIRFGDARPPDFWAEQGYDWYAGL